VRHQRTAGLLWEAGNHRLHQTTDDNAPDRDRQNILLSNPN
jgi:hypothetical protein